MQWYMNGTGLTQLQKPERKRLLRGIGSKIFLDFAFAQEKARDAG